VQPAPNVLLNMHELGACTVSPLQFTAVSWWML